MKTDLHNWDTIEELIDRDRNNGLLKMECFDHPFRTDFYVSNGEYDLEISCGKAVAYMMTPEQKQEKLNWMLRRMYRQFVRPCV